MITKIHKILVKAFFISSCLFSQETDKDALSPFPVELSIYEGYQSLLLNWSFNDSIVPKKIIKFNKNKEITIDKNYFFMNNGFIYHICRPNIFIIFYFIFRVNYIS